MSKANQPFTRVPKHASDPGHGPEPLCVSLEGEDYYFSVTTDGNGFIHIVVANGSERHWVPKLTPDEADTLAEMLQAASHKLATT